jgi:hypothetical protein
MRAVGYSSNGGTERSVFERKHEFRGNVVLGLLN